MSFLGGRRRWRSHRRSTALASPLAVGKITLLGLAIVGLFIVLTLQLARLQLLNGGEYSERSQANRLRELAVTPARGLIYDRHGTPLVHNAAAFAAVVTPADLPKQGRGEIFAWLERILGVPREEIEGLVREQLRLGDPFGELMVKSDLGEEETLTLKEALPRLPGVSLRSQPTRRYESGPLLAHVLGYVGPLDGQEYQRLKGQGYQLNDRIGKMGVELVYESFLRGRTGRRLVEIDAAGQELGVLRQERTEPGYNLVLTIDLDLQRKVKEVLEVAAGPGATAAAVVMDARDGSVLALVSLPSFDNNLFSRRLAAGELRELLENPSKPLVNHASAEIYAPGSTFKMVTGLAALQEGVATPNTAIVSRGYITVPNQYDPRVVYVFRDWAALGRLDFYQAIAMSSDVYFYYLAGGKEDEKFSGLGATRLAAYARAFGLGAPTGIDLTGEAAGLVPDPRWKEDTIGEAWVTGDSYVFGIGQGYLAVTPLQLASIGATVANGGRRVRPHVVQAITDNNGSVIAEIEGRTRKKVPVDSSSLAIMREAMRQSVDWGVAKRAQAPGIVVAGKTGTAEFGDPKPDGSHDTHGWFVGFAPYADPQVVIAVFVQRGSGGETAAPAAARIFDYIFHQTALVQELADQP